MNVDSNWGLTLLIFLYPNPPRHVIAASFPFETQVETLLHNSLDLFTINLTHSPQIENSVSFQFKIKM